jgi:hypothetical protein
MVAPHVALIDFTMHHPFGHCRSWAAHEADAIFHGSPKRFGSTTRYPLPSLGMWWRDVVGADFNGLTGRAIEIKYFGRRPKALNGADKLHRLSALGHKADLRFNEGTA